MHKKVRVGKLVHVDYHGQDRGRDGGLLDSTYPEARRFIKAGLVAKGPLAAKVAA